MSASYPAAIKTWPIETNEVNYPNNLKTIYATHITTIYPEITAIQNELGSGGVKTSVASSSASTYAAINGQSWSNLQSRLANIERGVIQLPTLRVSLSGGSTITPGAIGTVGLSVRATSGQTANLLEIRNASDTIVNRFSANGAFFGTIDGGSA
jgi:hypothetical protein